jgi:hypothetical protein
MNAEPYVPIALTLNFPHWNDKNAGPYVEDVQTQIATIKKLVEAGSLETYGEDDDRGHRWLELDFADTYTVTVRVADGFPEDVNEDDVIECISDVLEDSLSRKVTKTYGHEEKKVTADFKLVFEGGRIDGNTFTCTAKWVDNN